MASGMHTFWESTKKIACIGRNYAAHAKELGNAVPSKILFFLKPTTSLLRNGPIEIPPNTGVDHEVELAVVIGKKGRDISEASAMDYVAGYTIALDMTARSLQDAAKKAGQPWTAAKGFDTFCPIGKFIPKEKIPNPKNVGIWLKVNGESRQNGNTSDMIFSIEKCLAHISSVMTLEVGDIILTGTPEGVGSVNNGDVITAGLTVDGKSVADIEFPVKNRVSAKL
eukprot:TRINITY_DN1807_c0_g1_i1.p1 TRINITY_DN1807_c0_g1~~TRINITY_DN1807_c0_g1_i1.p1  ORF type:complete len:225 (-),score=34.13 TRINITY_DN1807_c0_g1_i1:291-965(-)